MKNDRVIIDENAENWINLMYCRDAAKGTSELRKELVKRLSPEVVKAMDECTSYDDFNRLLERYRVEEAP